MDVRAWMATAVYRTTVVACLMGIAGWIDEHRLWVAVIVFIVVGWHLAVVVKE